MHPIIAICLFLMMCFMCVIEAIETYKDFKYRYIKTGITEGALTIFCAFVAYCLVTSVLLA